MCPVLNSEFAQGNDGLMQTRCVAQTDVGWKYDPSPTDLIDKLKIRIAHQYLKTERPGKLQAD